MVRALIVEDHEVTLVALSEVLERRGFSTICARTYGEALAEINRWPLDIVMLDMVLPGGNGLELLREIPSGRQIDVVLMSGDEAMRDTLSALKMDSLPFLKKPLDFDELGKLLDAIRARRHLEYSGDHVTEVELVGKSARHREMCAAIETTDESLNISLTGESGSGRHAIVRKVHQQSSRADRALVTIECTGLPVEAGRSVIFGGPIPTGGGTKMLHGQLARAVGGTLFLAQLDGLNSELQEDLRMALKEHSDVRVIASCSKSIAELLDAGDLDSELVSLLDMREVLVPPLRDREGDVSLLADYFLKECNEMRGASIQFGTATDLYLEAYPWPGNVRQLKHVVETAAGRARTTLEPKHLSLLVRGGAEENQVVIVDVGSSIASVERKLIEATLAECVGDKTYAAKKLGISLRTLYNRLRDYQRLTPATRPQVR